MEDPGPISDQLSTKVGELFELNQRITSVLRAQAKDFESIGNTYTMLSMRAYEIVGLIGELATIAAANTGDIIIAEFGLAEERGEDDEEDGD